MILTRGITKKIISTLLVFITLSTASITAQATAYKTLDYSSFRDHSITSIHIGSDIGEITPTAFRGMKNLRYITVSENNPFYSSYSGCLYDKFKTELICFPPALSSAYIPNSVVSVGMNALNGVPENLKVEILAAIDGNESSEGMEWDAPGEHFVHIDNTVKWITANGDIVAPPNEAMALAAQIVNAGTTVSMTRAEQLEGSFKQLVKSIVYERSMETPSGDWVMTYAQNAMSTKKGNCYGYAAAFGYIARGLGYEARVCTGTVTSNLGGRTPHAWTEVKIGNKWYIFDAEMQRAKGGGYYKQTYDSYPAGPIQKESSYSVDY